MISKSISGRAYEISVSVGPLDLRTALLLICRKASDTFVFNFNNTVHLLKED